MKARVDKLEKALMPGDPINFLILIHEDGIYRNWSTGAIVDYEKQRNVIVVEFN